MTESLPKGWREAFREVHRYANDSYRNWNFNIPNGLEVRRFLKDLFFVAQYSSNPEPLPDWFKAAIKLQPEQLALVYRMAVQLEPENLAELAHAGISFSDPADQLLVGTSSLESCYDMRGCRPGNCKNLCMTQSTPKAET